MEDLEFGLRLERLSKRAKNIKRLADELDRDIYSTLVEFRTTTNQMTLNLEEEEDSATV